jgi:hypothetical protein
MAVKRIMRNIVLTSNLGIWYPKGSRFEIIGYSDADYGRCKVDKKSTFVTFHVSETLIKLISN